MIYLIGGIVKSGKTFLAKQILKEKGIAYFETDYLMMGLHQDPHFGLDCMMGDDLVSSLLYPILKKMITAMVENKETYLLEGVHLTPSLIQELSRAFPGKIKGIILGYLSVDLDQKIQEILSNDDQIGNNWYQEYTHEEFYQELTKQRTRNILLKKEALQLQVPYVDVVNITNELPTLIKILFKKEEK
jgi:2-phosphoglycerate kinase